MSFDIIVLTFSAISGVACAWMLFDLLRLPVAARRRLFWVQLCALAVTDLIEAVLGVMSGHWPKLSTGSCEFYIYARYTMEFSSALIEVQIGVGFLAACCHSDRVSWLLRRCLWFSWFLGGLLTLLSIAGGLHVIEDVENNNCNDEYQSGVSMWSVVILCLCSASIVLYAWSVCATANTPQVVRRKILARASMYVVNFLVTFGLRAVRGFINATSTPSGDFLERLSWILLCLNGFANVCTYAWQNGRRRQRTELSFHVDFAPTTSHYHGSQATEASRDPLMEHFTLKMCNDDSHIISGSSDEVGGSRGSRASADGEPRIISMPSRE